MLHVIKRAKLEQWFSKRASQASSISFIWEIAEMEIHRYSPST